MDELGTNLIDLGLSDKEAQAYLALVRHGTCPTSYLAKKAGLNRGTAYLALHGLLSKGLVSKNVKKNVQYFTPLSPENVRYYLERRQQEISSQISRSDDLVTQLVSLAMPLANKPKVQFFDGIEGAQTAMLDSLNAEESVLRSFLSIHDVADFLGADFFENYTNKRIHSGPELKAIRNLTKDKKAFSSNPYARKYVTSTKDRREVRYLEQPIEFPMSLYLYDEKVLVLSSRDEGFAIIIQSHDLSSMLKMLFDVLWGISASI